MRMRLIILAFVLLMALPAWAGGVSPLVPGQEVVGLLRHYEAGSEETLLEVAVKYGVGYNEIADANPGIDPWVPYEGERVVIPTRWVLPEGPREGIVVNLAEMRLYFFGSLNGRKVVSAYPIGVGLEGSETPVGIYSIGVKLEDPSWFVPVEFRRDNPKLPRVMPPGQDNPLGKFAMSLSGTQFLIHGTNSPFGIGRQVSHGCIRLYPRDIRELYSLSPPGTEVRVVYEPVKVGLYGGEVVVEVHSDYLGRNGSLMGEAEKALKKRGLAGRVDRRLLEKAVRESRGYPVPVGGEPAPIIEAAKEQESG
ncbi:MAG: L,D-transpeptidase family protein [Thermodesulfovibrionales bacterium]|nr:L,D-transpeptidase family protein [Thermodesulfovibrionales bacterium]